MPYSPVANTAWPSYRRIARSISNKTFFILIVSIGRPICVEGMVVLAIIYLDHLKIVM